MGTRPPARPETRPLPLIPMPGTEPRGFRSARAPPPGRAELAAGRGHLRGLYRRLRGSKYDPCHARAWTPRRGSAAHPAARRRVAPRLSLREGPRPRSATYRGARSPTDGTTSPPGFRDALPGSRPGRSFRSGTRSGSRPPSSAISAIRSGPPPRMWPRTKPWIMVPLPRVRPIPLREGRSADRGVTQTQRIVRGRVPEEHREEGGPVDDDEVGASAVLTDSEASSLDGRVGLSSIPGGSRRSLAPLASQPVDR